MVKDLTEGNPGRALALFSIPSLISVVFQQLYNMAEMWWRDSSLVTTPCRRFPYPTL